MAAPRTKVKNVGKASTYVSGYLTTGGKVVTGYQGLRHKAYGDAYPKQKRGDGVNLKKSTLLKPKTHNIVNPYANEEERLAAWGLNADKPRDITPHTLRELDNTGHTSTVFYFEDNKEGHGFFKPSSLESWSNAGRLYRNGIPDDKLGEREQLYANIAHTLGAEHLIPKAELVQMTGTLEHSPMNYSPEAYKAQSTSEYTGNGVMINDATRMLRDQGFADGVRLLQHMNDGSHEENRQRYQFADMNAMELLQPYGSTVSQKTMQSALHNGGMDIAVIDYIAGNQDRHDGNMFIGRNSDGEHKLIGFDHGLSFPNDKEFLAPNEIRNNLGGLWTYAMIDGNHLGLSSDMKNRLADPNTQTIIEKMIEKSTLSEASKKGAIARYKDVANHIAKHSDITGSNLYDIVSQNTIGWREATAAAASWKRFENPQVMQHQIRTKTSAPKTIKPRTQPPPDSFDNRTMPPPDSFDRH